MSNSASSLHNIFSSSSISNSNIHIHNDIKESSDGRPFAAGESFVKSEKPLKLIPRPDNFIDSADSFSKNLVKSRNKSASASKSSSKAPVEADPVLNKYESLKNITDQKTRDALKNHPAFFKVLESRYNNADPDVKALYNKYASCIKIEDIDSRQGSCYRASYGAIFIDAQSDIESPPVGGHAYYHEIGHLIDDNMIEGKAYATDNKKAFADAIVSDFENYVNGFMEKNCLTKSDAYCRIGYIMRNPINRYNYRCASDICGGLTEGKCQGLWGHDPEYWQLENNRISKEMFAHMFASAMGCPETMEPLKTIFPETYKEFMKIVKKEIAE